MNVINKKKLIALIVALIISGGFLWIVITPPSTFNLIPFAIHNAISPGGGAEKTFIVLFDIFISLIILWLGYKTIYKLISD